MNLCIRVLFVLSGMVIFSQVCHAETAVAFLRGTDPESKLEGKISLTDTEAGLQIVAKIKGAPPGMHGFHIHEFGSCNDKGKAAGGHYNPEHVNHGELLENGFKFAHAGDLGNISITPNGAGSLNKTIPELSLSSGNYTVAGRAFILHADPDDFGQPTGNAGARIGCGTIIITGK